MEPQLSIIIVNWNGEKFLPDCLRSIAENPPSVPYEVIVADNDSSDGSQEWLASEDAKNIFPNGVFQYIQTGENLGFGKANNLVIEKTKTPFVFLLNPDTIVKEEAINKLLKTLRMDSKAKMAVPRVIGIDGKPQGTIWPTPSASKFLVEGFNINRIIPTKRWGEWLLGSHWTYDRKRYIPLASGCAMMVDRTVINEIGAFDPKIFMYGEDADWCNRINKSGWKIIFEPSAELIHIGGQSSSQKWSNVETRMREERAFLNVQEIVLSPFQIVRISSARIIVFFTRFVLRYLMGKNNEFLSKIISLQVSAFGRSLKRIFRIPNNKIKSTL